MTTTKAFNMAKLIRHLSYDETTDTIVTGKSLSSEDEKRSIERSFTLTTANQTLDSFSSTIYKSAQYIVHATQGTDFHTTVILVSTNGTVVHTTEYSTLRSGTDLVTLSASIAAGTVTLQVTPAKINTTVKYSAEYIAA